MSEYIGSRIALISKSDIKYIGTLHEINSENSTVALENVKSQGTEGRRSGQDEVPPSETIYEYIVFRGSDVKELSIVEAPKENKPPAAVPNDPAILGSARPPQYQQQPPPPQQQDQFRGPPHFQPPMPNQYEYQHNAHQQFPPQASRFQGPGGVHGFPGQPGAVPGYNPAFMPPPPNYGMPYGGPPPGAFGHPHHPPPPAGFSPGPPNPIAPPGQRAPPTEPQAQRAQQKPAEMSSTPAPTQPKGNVAPPVPANSKPVTTAQAAATAAATTPAPEAKPQAKKAPNNRVAVPLPSAAKPAAKPAATKTDPPAAAHSYADATQAATAAVAEAMAKLNTNAATIDATNRTHHPRTHDNTGRGRGRGRGSASNVARGGQANRQSSRGVDVPKEDYDFQQANAKFNKEDLVKEAIATGSPVASPPAVHENGTGPVNGDEDVIIPPKPAVEKGYNKQTSFFDNISSDLKDRSEAVAFDGRSMRREERSKNFETFGQGSVDGGHRGGFRGGRGRGRGRGGQTGGFHRGGGGGGGGGRGRGPAEAAAVLASTS